ncbi:hypothetical protein F4810DRAFT_192234 [Camillea tinctor]|nr:hypothetical protein F4810DRAFT_192234 [Camillea tinctor]
MSEYIVGQTIQLNDGRNAVIRFVGQAHFAPGDWIGVELEDESGKNDGSVQGERYFDCSPGKGMFVRPMAVSAVLAAPPPRVPPGRRPSRANTGGAGAATGLARPGSRSDVNVGKRKSLNAPSPSPVPRASRPSSISRSPTKSPTKQLGTATSSNATSRTGTPSNIRGTGVGARNRGSVGGGRTSMGPPALPSAGARRQPSTSSAAVTRAGPARPRVSTGPARGPVRPPSGRVPSGESLSGNEALPKHPLVRLLEDLLVADPLGLPRAMLSLGKTRT